MCWSIKALLNPLALFSHVSTKGIHKPPSPVCFESLHVDIKLLTFVILSVADYCRPCTECQKTETHKTTVSTTSFIGDHERAIQEYSNRHSWTKGVISTYFSLRLCFKVPRGNTTSFN